MILSQTHNYLEFNMLKIFFYYICIQFFAINANASQGIYIEDENRSWQKNATQRNKKVFVPFDVKIEEESITDQYIKKEEAKKTKTPRPDSELLKKIKGSKIYPQGKKEETQRLIGGYRKLSLFGSAYQTFGTAKATEKQLESGESATYDLFRLDNIKYDTAFQVGMAFGTANKRLRGEYEISYTELGGAGKIQYDKTNYVAGSDIEIDKESLQLGIANFSWNNYINLFRYKDYEFFAGIGIGAAFVFPKSKNLEANFAAPTLQVMFGTSFDIGSNAKMNLVYKVQAMDLNLYHKFPYKNNGISLNNDRSIDDSFTNYQYLMQMFGIEIMAF